MNLPFKVAICVVGFWVLTGCGGGGTTSNSRGSTLGSASATIGPTGGTLALKIPSGETLTIPAGALVKPTTVSISAASVSIPLKGSGFTQASHSITLHLPPDAISPQADITLSAKYSGAIDTSDPSSFVVVMSNGTIVTQTLTNLTATPQLELNQNSHTFVAHLTPVAVSPINKQHTLAIGSDLAIYELIVHTPSAAELNPKIRTFLFRSEAATLAQARQADQRDQSDAISGECWTPLDQSMITDGSRKRVAILVHGINNRINNMSALAYYLAHLTDVSGKAVYDQVWGIDHDWEGSIAPRGDQLAQFINSKLGNRLTTADLFGHSQGTLVTRYALEISGGNCKTHVSRVYLFAPMNKGIPVGLANEFRAIGSIVGFGYIGVKEMLREPDEWYKKYWYLLDRLINDGGQGVVPYFVFTGGNPSSYHYGALTLWYGSSDHDGIVPWDSSKYIPPSHSNVWTEYPSSQYSSDFILNHSEVVGRFENSSANLNLNDSANSGGTPDILRTAIIGDSSVGQGPYTSVDLGTLGGTWAGASGLSSTGAVAGTSQLPAGSADEYHGFLWANGTMTDLGRYSYQSGTNSLPSTASGINAAGTVIGTVWDRIPGRTAGYTYRAGTSTRLPTANPSAYEALPAMIHDDGDIVGEVMIDLGGAGVGHPTLWRKGVERDLFPDVGYYGGAACVNKNGKVLVNTDNGYGELLCFVWQDGQALIRIQSPQFTGSWINDSDVIVGSYVDGTHTTRAQRWVSGTSTDLGTLGGDSVANCVNGQGMIVGYSNLASGVQHAFVWSNGVMKDLNDLVQISGWTLQNARSINDAGQILCDGVRSGTLSHAFVLTPNQGPRHSRK